MAETMNGNIRQFDRRFIDPYCWVLGRPRSPENRKIGLFVTRHKQTTCSSIFLATIVCKNAHQIYQTPSFSHGKRIKRITTTKQHKFSKSIGLDIFEKSHTFNYINITSMASLEQIRIAAIKIQKTFYQFLKGRLEIWQKEQNILASKHVWNFWPQCIKWICKC